MRGNRSAFPIKDRHPKIVNEGHHLLPIALSSAPNASTPNLQKSGGIYDESCCTQT